MPSMFDLPSWDKSRLTKRQSEKFLVSEAGEAIHSGRKAFFVWCRDCDSLLHAHTTDPSVYIEKHEEEGCFETTE